MGGRIAEEAYIKTAPMLKPKDFLCQGDLEGISFSFCKNRPGVTSLRRGLLPKVSLGGDSLKCLYTMGCG